MPKCPYCGKDINKLINVQSAIVEWDFYIRDGIGDYGAFEIKADGDINEWVCPRCRKVIADNEEDATEFLIS